MVRGPRNANARKMERALRHTHAVDHGPSIIELLEAELTEVCVQYRVLRADDYELGDAPPLGDREGSVRRQRTIAEARGRIRGLAISVAMMRHPLRRHETAWWGYVKKLEKRHNLLAKEKLASGDALWPYDGVNGG
jgi:hypothetical protein